MCGSMSLGLYKTLRSCYCHINAGMNPLETKVTTALKPLGNQDQTRIKSALEHFKTKITPTLQRAPRPCSRPLLPQHCNLVFREHAAAAAASDCRSTAPVPLPGEIIVTSTQCASSERRTCSQSTMETWAVWGGGARRRADDRRRALDAAVLQGLGVAGECHAVLLAVWLPLHTCSEGRRRTLQCGKLCCR